MARVALVTGGSRGIGAAISMALQAAGYKVAATYAGNDAAAAAFKAETGIAVYKWDVADYEACKAGIAAGRGRAGAGRRAGQQCRHHPRCDVPPDDAASSGSEVIVDQCRQPVQHDPAGVGGDARPQVRPDHQHQLGQRPEGPVRPDQLRGGQGRRRSASPRRWRRRVRRSGSRSTAICPGYIGTEMVAAVPEEVLKSEDPAADPGRPAGRARGDRALRGVPRQRRGRLHHRLDADRPMAASTWPDASARRAAARRRSANSRDRRCGGVPRHGQGFRRRQRSARVRSSAMVACRRRAQTLQPAGRPADRHGEAAAAEMGREIVRPDLAGAATAELRPGPVAGGIAGCSVDRSEPVMLEPDQRAVLAGRCADSRETRPDCRGRSASRRAGCAPHRAADARSQRRRAAIRRASARRARTHRHRRRQAQQIDLRRQLQAPTAGRHAPPEPSVPRSSGRLDRVQRRREQLRLRHQQAGRLPPRRRSRGQVPRRSRR